MLASSSRTTATSCRGFAASQSVRTSLSSLQEQRRHNTWGGAQREQRQDSRRRPDKDKRQPPYNFQNTHRYRGGSTATPLARYNLELDKFISRNQTLNVFKTCQAIKRENLRPDHHTYTYLLQACRHGQLTLEARAVFEDMVNMGIQPRREEFHALLQALEDVEVFAIRDVLDQMEGYGIEPDAITYEILILRCTPKYQVEQALQYLGEMNAQGLTPTLKTAQSLVVSASKLGLPRLALDLAELFEHDSTRRLDGEVWVECLISSAEALFADGVNQAWKRVVHENGITPDEGCCIKVLHTAARHGLSRLALEVLQKLEGMKVTWAEHHYAPVIEAFCNGSRLEEAIAVIELMQSNGVVPSLDTTEPISDYIKKSDDTLDRAWEILETMHENGKKVDVIALNVILQAAVSLNDLQRAIGIYKAFEQFGVKPVTETYNLLLSACIRARHRDLGDRLLADMKDANVKPDVETYKALIMLCLTQTTYEDAFFYLEEMKAEGMKPPKEIYEHIIRKCVVVGDTRYRLALEEYKENGYEVSWGLQRFIDSGGAPEPRKKPAPSRESEHEEEPIEEDTKV